MKLSNDFRPVAIIGGAVHAAMDRQQEGMRVIESMRQNAAMRPDSEDDAWYRRILGFYFRQREPMSVDAAGVAHIHVLGALSKDLPPIYTYVEETDYDDIARELTAALNDDKVRGIQMRIDSPGGCITGLPELAALIAQVREVKPVFALVENMACSAAQWLASACSATYCTPSSEVGSIGVILARMDYSKMLDEAGIKYELIVPEECDLKSSYWPVAPLTDEQRTAIQTSVERTNAAFRSAIEKYRGITLDTALARGQVLDPEEAMAGGIIDAIASPAECYADLLAVLPPPKEAHAAQKLTAAVMNYDRDPKTHC